MSDGGLRENLSLPGGEIPSKEVWAMSVDEKVVKRGGERLKVVLDEAESKLKREFDEWGLKVEMGHYLEDVGRAADLNKGLEQNFASLAVGEKLEALVDFFDSEESKEVPIEVLLLLDRQAFSGSDKEAMYKFLKVEQGGDRLAMALGERIRQVSSLEGLKRFRDNLEDMTSKKVLPTRVFEEVEAMVGGRVLNLVQLEMAPKVGRLELMPEELERYVDTVMNYKLWSDPEKGGGAAGKAELMQSLGEWIVDGMRDAVDRGADKERLKGLISELRTRGWLSDKGVESAELMLRVS